MISVFPLIKMSSLHQYPDPSKSNYLNFTQDEIQLIEAVRVDNLDRAKKLLAVGTNPDLIPVRDEWSIIQVAVMFGQSQMIKLLLAKSSYERFHDRDKQNRSLLHLACLSKNLETVSVILRHREIVGGVEILDWVDAFGNTALHYARAFGNHDIAIKLIVFGANSFIKNNAGRRAKDEPEAEKKVKEFEKLIEDTIAQEKMDGDQAVDK